MANRRIMNRRSIKPIKSFTESIDEIPKPKKQIILQQKIDKFNTKFYDLVMKDEHNEPHIYLSLIFTKEYFYDLQPLKRQGLNIFYTSGNDADGIKTISPESYNKDKYYGLLLSQVPLPITSEIIVDNESIKLYEIDMAERMSKIKANRIK